MSKTKIFIKNLTNKYIINPLETLGDGILAIPKKAFKTVQQETENELQRNENEQGFYDWLERQSQKPSVKPLIIRPKKQK